MTDLVSSNITSLSSIPLVRAEISDACKSCTTDCDELKFLKRLIFLSILELEPLELRRLRFDLIQYYKILNSLTPLNYAEYFTFHQPSSSSRNSSPFLIKPFNSPNYLLSSFFNRQWLLEFTSSGTERRWFTWCVQEKLVYGRPVFLFNWQCIWYFIT